LRGLVVIARHERDARAFGEKSLGNCPSDTCSAARDGCDLVVKFHALISGSAEFDNRDDALPRMTVSCGMRSFLNCLVTVVLIVRLALLLQASLLGTPTWVRELRRGYPSSTALRSKPDE